MQKKLQIQKCTKCKNINSLSRILKRASFFQLPSHIGWCPDDNFGPIVERLHLGSDPVGRFGRPVRGTNVSVDVGIERRHHVHQLSGGDGQSTANDGQRVANFVLSFIFQLNRHSFILPGPVHETDSGRVGETDGREDGKISMVRSLVRSGRLLFIAGRHIRVVHVGRFGSVGCWSAHSHYFIDYYFDKHSSMQISPSFTEIPTHMELVTEMDAFDGTGRSSGHRLLLQMLVLLEMELVLLSNAGHGCSRSEREHLSCFGIETGIGQCEYEQRE
jgi:hypothetical protein